jgi:hypothetical protein
MKNSTLKSALLVFVLFITILQVNADTNNIATNAASRISTQDYVYTIIDVNGTRFADQMMIFTVDGCTRNFDNGWDGRKMFGNPVTPQLFAMEADGNYQINSIDDINNSNLGFKAGEDTTYTLKFTHENLGMKYAELYLIDLANNKTIDVTSTGAQYTFNAKSTIEPVKRFQLVTSKPQAVRGVTTQNNDVAGSSEELKVFSSNQTIFIKNNSAEAGVLRLFDLSGKFVKELTFGALGIATFQNCAPVGAYFIKGGTASNPITSKLMLR